MRRMGGDLLRSLAMKGKKCQGLRRLGHRSDWNVFTCGSEGAAAKMLVIPTGSMQFGTSGAHDVHLLSEMRLYPMTLNAHHLPVSTKGKH